MFSIYNQLTQYSWPPRAEESITAQDALELILSAENPLDLQQSITELSQATLIENCADGAPLLHHIILDGHLGLLLSAFEGKNLDPAVVSADGSNLLSILMQCPPAVRQLDETTFYLSTEYLLEAGLSPTSVNIVHGSALYYAAKHNHIHSFTIMAKHTIVKQVQLARKSSMIDGIDMSFVTAVCSDDNLTVLGIALTNKHYLIASIMLRMGFALADNVDLTNHQIEKRYLAVSPVLHNSRPSLSIVENRLHKFLILLNDINSRADKSGTVYEYSSLFFFAQILQHKISLTDASSTILNQAMRHVLLRIPGSLERNALNTLQRHNPASPIDFLESHRYCSFNRGHLLRFQKMMQVGRGGRSRAEQIESLEKRIELLKNYGSWVNYSYAQRCARVSQARRGISVFSKGASAVMGASALAVYANKIYNDFYKFGEGWRTKRDELEALRGAAIAEYEACYPEYNQNVITWWYNSTVPTTGNVLEHSDTEISKYESDWDLCYNFYSDVLYQLNSFLTNPNTHKPPRDESREAYDRLSDRLHACYLACISFWREQKDFQEQLEEHNNDAPDIAVRILIALGIAAGVVASAFAVRYVYQHKIASAIDNHLNRVQETRTEQIQLVNKLKQVIQEEKFDSSLAQVDDRLSELLGMEDYTPELIHELADLVIDYYQGLIKILNNKRVFPVIDFVIQAKNDASFRHFADDAPGENVMQPLDEETAESVSIPLLSMP